MGQGGLLLARFAVAVALAMTGAARAADDARPADDPHAKIFEQSSYPSATVCASCHPRVFAEWSSSNHAYAAISPMFHRFEQRINDLTTGTIGDFCIRCHQQVGAQLGEPREQAVWERPPVAREGVTCVTCHRVDTMYGKVNGERQIEPGPVTDPVYGAGRGSSLASVQAHPAEYGLKDARRKDGKEIHSAAIRFEQIDKAEFCVSCHQVAVNLGIKLEVVWDQYRASPALAKGITCHDCHMGKVPGEALGYETGPIAMVNGRPIGDGKARHSNHAFFGPGYPIAHPGLFPFNPRALEWSVQDWLAFDYRAGWGTPEFEKRNAGHANFPAAWKSRDARERARLVIEQNEKALEYKKRHRIEVMENGSRIDGPFIDGEPRAGKALKFTYRVSNVDEGHNLPSGSLGAQPEIWLDVALIDPSGRNVWESGYVDSAGDMADLHSADVRAGTLPHDDQLFNLQTKFLTTNVKGTDREMYLPVNFDVDQLPFLRPAGVPTTVINHPPLVRMEQRSIPPQGHRDAAYRVPGKLIAQPGKYRLLVRLRSRAEPMYFMKFVGATTDMEQAINDWMIDIHPYAAEFEVRP